MATVHRTLIALVRLLMPMRLSLITILSERKVIRIDLLHKIVEMLGDAIDGDNG